jgi:hypothetical protein
MDDDFSLFFEFVFKQQDTQRANELQVLCFIKGVCFGSTLMELKGKDSCIRSKGAGAAYFQLKGFDER